MSSAGEERVSIDTYTSTTTVHTLAGHRPPPPAPPRPGRRPRRLRFMKRDGRFQVVFRDERGSWSPYLLDIYTTLVETRWRLMLLLFSLSYILSWLLFALLYWLMAYAHGDLAPPPDGGGGCAFWGLLEAILATLAGGSGVPSLCCSARRFRLLGLSALRELWKSLRFFSSGAGRPDGGAGAGGGGETSALGPAPLEDPEVGARPADSPPSLCCPGSISFCQARTSFLARLARSSFLVFLRTSLISLPRRVSLRDVNNQIDNQ